MLRKIKRMSNVKINNMRKLKRKKTIFVNVSILSYSNLIVPTYFLCLERVEAKGGTILKKVFKEDS